MSDFKLNFIHLCDEATFSQEGKLSLIGIFDVVNLINLPGNLVKAVLVCNLSVLNPKLNTIKLNITVSKEGEKDSVFKLPTITANLTKKQNTDVKDEEIKMGITLQLTNLSFKSEGNYFINVVTNDDLLGSYKFIVKRIRPKGDKS